MRLEAARPVLFALMLVLSHASPAAAFKEPGHRAIEAAAYTELLATQPSVISTLLRYRVLRVPKEPVALDPARDFEDFTVNGLVVESHLPDHVFERQLHADRQCFHFNARGGHLTRYSGKPNALLWDGVPRGLVEDAYVDCIGVADALLRSILMNPVESAKSDTGIYPLMHLIEDSFADSHVARDASRRILYLKPWNLRTWLRYFFANEKGLPVHSHFSEQHHMGSDARDFGYLVGPRDSEYLQAQAHADRDYEKRVQSCKSEVAPLLRKLAKDIRFSDLEGEVVVPETCLSTRAIWAKEALVALLVLIAEQIPSVQETPGVQERRAPELQPSRVGGVKLAPGFALAWYQYRLKHLAHCSLLLTKYMSLPSVSTNLGARVACDALPPADVPQPAPYLDAAQNVRRDQVYLAQDLKPHNFRETGVGLTTELRTGTPLWLGTDLFLTRNTAGHNKTILLLDTLGVGVQLRLPIENEIAERPVGIAFDIGPGLPVPVSELLGFDEMQVYIGARARIAYTAESVFESETRHVLELGFGGVSLDFIIANQVWFGIDGPRTMVHYDFWTGSRQWDPAFWSFSGGVVVDAF